MRRGCHVFSEKPMALTVRECDRICRVAAQTGRRFMTAQCLRFWPEYEALLTAVREQPYGPLQSLTMTRIGSYATWSDWFNNGARSGGAILDLHLHDVDWAFHAFGAPAALWAAGRRGKTGEYDDVTAVWQYPEFNVTLRGSWMYQGFCMSFQALFAEAAMDFGMHPDPALRVRRAGNAEAEKIAVPAESGYQREIRYFLDVIRGCREHDLCPPESTRNSVQMVYMEREAIAKSRPVTKFKLI